EGCLVSALDCPGVPGAGVCAHFGFAYRYLLPRGFADARGHLPGPSGVQRTSGRHGAAGIPNGAANLRSLHENSGLRRGPAIETARRTMSPLPEGFIFGTAALRTC